MIDNIMIYSALGIFLLMAFAYYLGRRKTIKELEEKICCGIDEHSGFKKLCERFDKLDMDFFKLNQTVKANTNFKEEHKYIRNELDKKIKEAGIMEMTPQDNEEIQLLKQELKKLKKKIKELSPEKDKEKIKTP